MNIFHSPACRITGVSVGQGGTPNQALSLSSFAVTINVSIFDQGIWTSPGTLSIRHTIMQGTRVVNEPITNWWLALAPVRFNTGFWASIFWSQAGNAVPGAQYDAPFLYKPSLTISMWGPGGPGISPIREEFAVAEEDCYFSMAYGAA
jgi:hypothetical protein